MFEITGIDKASFKRVIVAIANNLTELRLILRQETRNYFCLSFTRTA